MAVMRTEEAGRGGGGEGGEAVLTMSGGQVTKRLRMTGRKRSTGGDGMSSNPRASFTGRRSSGQDAGMGTVQGVSLVLAGDKGWVRKSCVHWKWQQGTWYPRELVSDLETRPWREDHGAGSAEASPSSRRPQCVPASPCFLGACTTPEARWYPH